jgi:hypothetical protein
MESVGVGKDPDAGKRTAVDVRQPNRRCLVRQHARRDLAEGAVLEPIPLELLVPEAVELACV